MQTSFSNRFSEFVQRRGKKNTLYFSIPPQSIDPSLLNTTALRGVSQPNMEMELADTTDKDVCVSKFKCLTADFEDVTHVRRQLLLRIPDLESLMKQDKPVFHKGNATPDIYIHIRVWESHLGVLLMFGSTYVCVMVCHVNVIKTNFCGGLTASEPEYR